MGKAKMLGMPTKYVPNNKADDRHHHKFHQKYVPEKETPKYKAGEPKSPICKFNEGVCCVRHDHTGSPHPWVPKCETCGWNPAVAKARLEKRFPAQHDTSKKAE